MKNMESKDLFESLSSNSTGTLLFGGARMALLDVEAGFWSIRRQIEALIGPQLTNSVLQQAGANGGASFAESFGTATDAEEQGNLFKSCVGAYQAAGFGKFDIEEIHWPIGKVVVRAEDAFESWMMLKNGQQVEGPVCAYAAGVLVGFVNVISERQDVVCIERHCQVLGDDFCEFELLPVKDVDDQSVVAFTPDPTLSQQLNLLEMLFERMPMGIAILDSEYHIQRFNPTWMDFSERYAPPSGEPLVPGIYYFDHLPGAESVVLPRFERVLKGETVQQTGMRLEAGGIETYWDIVLAPLFENDEVVGILNISVDATERIQTQQALQENQRTLSTLISNLPGMAYRCANDEHWTMEFVSEGSLLLTGYHPDELVENNRVSYGELIHPEDRQMVRNEIQAALREERPFQINYRIRTKEGIKWVWEQGQGVTNLEGKVIVLEGFITDITERVMAQQNLEQRVDERTRELASLLDISNNLASTLDLNQLLDLILNQLGGVLAYDAASIMILEGDMLKIIAYHGPIEQDEALQIRFPVQDAKANQEVIHQRRPVIIPDIHKEDPLANAIRKIAGDELETTYSYLRCWMGIPLIVKEQVVGMLTLDHRDPDHYVSAQAELALTFANQAAVAIENARLYQEAEHRAEESEALFSVQRAITSRLEMGDVLQMIADEARRLTKTDISAVYLVRGDKLEISYVSGDVSENILGYRLSLDNSIAGQVVKSQEAVLVPDTWTDSRVDRGASDQVQARSLLIVPLATAEKPIGTITVANRTPGGFMPEDERLLTRLAANVVISVENARLYQAEYDRRQVAEGLRDILAVLNSDLPLDEIFAVILDQACHLLNAQAGVAYRVDHDKDLIEIEAVRDMPDGFMDIHTLPIIESDANQTVLNGHPFAVSNLRAQLAMIDEEELDAISSVQKWKTIVGKHFDSYLSAPIVIKGHVYGALSLFYTKNRKFSKEEIDLVVTLTDQAALAVENAMLRTQATEMAKLSERSRLARDLHDAVSQTLFSASLIADVLPKLWNRNPELGEKKLNELGLLTRGALSEMRTMLLELRPAALVDMDLEDLLRTLTNAFTGRTRVPVEVKGNGQVDPPLPVKEVFYRVAQEALNNITKHAEASQVTVHLLRAEHQVQLKIQDDGRGFDPQSLSPENLGLGIMHERAETIGANLEIHSEIEKGTYVKLFWKDEQ